MTGAPHVSAECCNANSKITGRLPAFHKNTAMLTQLNILAPIPIVMLLHTPLPELHATDRTVHFKKLLLDYHGLHLLLAGKFRNKPCKIPYTPPHERTVHVMWCIWTVPTFDPSKASISVPGGSMLSFYLACMIKGNIKMGPTSFQQHMQRR